MPRKPQAASMVQLVHHPKDDATGLDRFRKVIGSIALKGPVPSKKFLCSEDEHAENDARD
jgi:hypothetical protein